VFELKNQTHQVHSNNAQGVKGKRHASPARANLNLKKRVLLRVFGTCIPLRAVFSNRSGKYVESKPFLVASFALTVATWSNKMGKRQKKYKLHRERGDAADQVMADLNDEQRATADAMLSTLLKMSVVRKCENKSHDQLQQTLFDTGLCDVITEQSRIAIEARRHQLDPRAAPKVSRIVAETRILLPATGIWSQDILNAHFSWHCEGKSHHWFYPCLRGFDRLCCASILASYTVYTSRRTLL
jgi:hypothetical protein